jgi:hypothetical protein
MWNKIKQFFKNSMTIMWARLQVATGISVAFLMTLATDPHITGAIENALQPRFIPYYVIAIGLITEMARRRTAGTAE